MPKRRALFTRAGSGRRAIALLGLVPLLLGCTVGPDFLRPDAPAQSGYEAGGDPKPDVPPNTTGVQRLALGQKIEGDWWTLFHAGRLDEVVELAIAGNHNLAAARTTLAEAQEVVREVAGERYPQVDLASAGSRQRVSLKASGFNAPDVTYNVFSIGPSVRYTVDAFGSIARQVEQQQAEADYQDFELDAAYLTITGNVVMQAVTIASLRGQLAVVEQIIADDRSNLDLVQKAFAAGSVAQTDVESAHSQVTADRTRRSPLRQQLSVARHRLAILVGKAPADWTPPAFALADFTLPRDLPVSLPSALVRQRPDILAAEAQLHAASAAVGVATAALYPNITLSAAIGEDTPMLKGLFGPGSTVWNFGGGLTAPLFHGGTLQAQKRAAEDAFQSSLSLYQETVLEAFGQVADVLQALAHDEELVQNQAEAIAAAQSSLRLARLAYASGGIAFLQVLDAERLYQQALLGEVSAKAQQFLDTAQLFAAMGGGWWEWRSKDADSCSLPACPSAGARLP